MLTTSIENIAAAMGVPNNAEKHALMLHIIIIRVSLSSNLRSFAKKLPIEPPTCSAAPSLPAEPPKRWVIIVETIISGATLAGTSSFDWIAVITRLVPLPACFPASLYKNTIKIPDKGRKNNI